MCLSPLSGETLASFPHVFESSWKPPAPNPILESQVKQSFSLFAMMPILAFEWELVPTTLNPSLLQFGCSEPSGPTRDFHLLRPNETARYAPSAISAYNELALWRMTTNLVVEPSLIPRQIFEKSYFLANQFLQMMNNEAWGPARYFHLLRPSGNLRYIPSAISEYNELALRRMTTNLVVKLFLIPRQIFEKREQNIATSNNEVPIFQSGNANTKKYKCSTLEKSTKNLAFSSMVSDKLEIQGYVGERSFPKTKLPFPDWESSGKDTPIPVTPADRPTCSVCLLDLPVEISDASVRTVFEAFGDVFSVCAAVFKDFSSVPPTADVVMSSAPRVPHVPQPLDPVEDNFTVKGTVSYLTEKAKAKVVVKTLVLVLVKCLKQNLLCLSNHTS
ncbi:hypothetical protein P5673_025939 [Acropora cervicornis]|uniref:Uncharacterized protein n=1 Tax=Acropora cervicornis TaxID=6130 RepID=A0AAD9UX01_ACRCE|nr:hypothetical protein P5673_025939 [Acropora cervicornis]